MGAEITRLNVLDMQVCVPKDYTDEQVENFARIMTATARWSIRREGDKALAGDPERVPCEQRNGHVHIMLDC